MFDLVTVGHFAIDLIHSPKILAPIPTLGGPPTYVSLAATQLHSKVSVISKVGENFPSEYISWLKVKKVDLLNIHWMDCLTNSTKKLRANASLSP